MVAVEAATQFLQDQVVIQYLELLLLLAVATAERTDASQLMVVLAVAAVGIILVKESLSELQAKVILVVERIKVDTELLAVAAARVAWVPMRLHNILEAQEVLEFRQRSRGLLRTTAAAVVAVSMTTVAVTAPTAEALVVLAVAETAAVLGTAVVLISTARRAVQILVVAEEELTLNQHSQAMADQELSLFVT